MPDRPWVIGHRGAPYQAVENTSAAFAAAWAVADAVELDVQMTADGVAVLYHDARLGGAGFFTADDPQPLVSDIPWAVLATARFDEAAWWARVSAQAVDRLERPVLVTPPEILRLADLVVPPGKGVFIELKSPENAPCPDDGMEAAVAAWLQTLPDSAWAVAISFDPQRLMRLRQLAPDIVLGLTVRTGDPTLTDARALAAARDALGIRYWLPTFKDIAAAEVNRAAAAGLGVVSWASAMPLVAEQTHIQRLSVLGVAGLITNQPEWAAAQVILK